VFTWSAALALGIAIMLLLILAALGLLVTAAPVRAQEPSPIDRHLWAFPSSTTAPSDAFSASFAQADRWLGESPFENPAAFAGRGFQASGALLRMSRQDLRAESHSFDETDLYIDFGSAWLSLPVGGWGLSAYAHQPVLRLEDNAFLQGEVGGPVPPGQIQSSGSSRELHAGLALSRGLGWLRLGVAGEWQYRTDVYEYIEQSGSPDMGTRHVDFSGSGVGFQAGLRIGEELDAPFSLGAAARWSPALTVEGEQHLDLLSGDSVAVVTAEREAGVDAGVSAACRLTRQFRALAGFGVGTERTWEGFGVTTGEGTHWALAGEFHDDRDPWTLRFGGGQQLEDGAAEKSSTLVGLGIGWAFEGTRLDFGLLHRTIQRDNKPNSFDDRLLVTVSTGF
jgi:hypothetical protein